MDQKKIEEAVKLFLEGIGEEVNREGLADTPKRIVKMCEELFGGLNKEPEEYFERTFEAVNNEIIIEKDISFYSVCEHHLLPFYGKAYIGYIPDGKVAGLSKIARTVETYARRPQIQEQLTAQIADAIMKYLKPKGVIVLLEAEHMCMTMRGVQKPGTKTTTLLGRGIFKDNTEMRNTFFQLIR